MADANESRDVGEPHNLSRIGDEMSEQEKEIRLEGIVHCFPLRPSHQGKQFLGAEIRCSDGMVWVIDYDERSPNDAFADRRVVVFGERCKPPICHRLFVGHFRVSTMRLVEMTPDAEIIEVGARQHLSGQFERGTSDAGESTLSFVTEKGDTFLVANDSAGVNVGSSVKVQAYPVQPAPSIRLSPKPYLWVICPCWCAECFEEWRRRSGSAT